MAHRLLFYAEEAEAAPAERDLTTLPACVRVLEFRRDLVASDPDWTRMQLLPRPDSSDVDRYLELVFAAPPPAEEVRDLRYVAARNRLTMLVLS